MHYLAIDIGGTTIQYAILDENLNMLQQWSTKTLAFTDKNQLYDYVFQHGLKSNLNFDAIGVRHLASSKMTVISQRVLPSMFGHYTKQILLKNSSKGSINLLLL